jgi:hypothetical protein
VQQLQDQVALAQRAQRELAQHEGVAQHVAVGKPSRDALGGAARMVDPERGIDQDQARFPRRRGGA